MYTYTTNVKRKKSNINIKVVRKVKNICNQCTSNQKKKIQFHLKRKIGTNTYFTMRQP